MTEQNRLFKFYLSIYLLKHTLQHINVLSKVLNVLNRITCSSLKKNILYETATLRCMITGSYAKIKKKTKKTMWTKNPDIQNTLDKK